MEGQAVSRLFLSLCAFALLCVLLSGLPRLIGEEPQGASAAPEPKQACLTASASADELCGAPRAEAFLRSREQAMRVARLCAPPVPELRRDANGNVLAGASYLRTVYRAFSLGDGFV